MTPSWPRKWGEHPYACPVAILLWALSYHVIAPYRRERTSAQDGGIAE